MRLDRRCLYLLCLIVVAGVAVLSPGAGSAATPSVSADPASFTFTNREVGSSQSHTFTFTNTGDIALFVYSYSGASASGAEGNPTGGTCTTFPRVAPGDSCTVELTYTITCRCPILDSSFEVDFTAQRNVTDTFVRAQVSLPGGGRGTTSHPNAELSPGDDIDFGSSSYPGSAAKALFLRNNSDLPVEVSSAAFSGSHPQFVVGADGCSGAVLQPDDVCALTFGWFVFPGANSATFRIETTGGNFDVHLHGTGLVPFSIDGSLDFGSVVMGQTATRTATLTNTSDSALDLQAPIVGGGSRFAVTGGTCGGVSSLVSGASCTYEVTFTPDGPGGADGSLAIDTVGLTYPAMTQLHGVGLSATPHATLGPATLNFFGAVGVPTAAQTLTLTSDGTVPVSISSAFSIVGPFAITGGTCGLITAPLSPGTSCTIAIAFTATIPFPQTGGIQVQTSSGFLFSNFSGTGFTGTHDGVGDPDPFDLGTVDVGQTGPAQTLRIRSTGTGPMQVFGWAFPAGVTVSGGTCTTLPTVLPGDSCTFELRFTPTAAGAFTGNGFVNVVDRPGGSVLVHLTGTGHLVDATPPVTTPALQPAPNAAGWNRGDVTVTLASTDNQGGSGVKQIEYSAGGAQAIAATTVAGSSAQVVVTAPGTTTVHFHAVDVAGNAEADRTLVIKIDRVVPTVAFSGNLGSYDVTATVHIGCNASDALSGLDSALTTCPTVDAPAYSLGAGAHSLQATATDKAGNVSTARTTYTVTVNATSLCKLTTQFVQTSPKYLSLSPRQRATADALAQSVCAQLTKLQPRLTPAEKAAAIRAYKQGVAGAVPLGWLTQAQATTLSALADAL